MEPYNNFPNINKEYSRCLLVKRLVAIMPSPSLKSHEEALNVLERYLLTCSEDFSQGDDDPIFSVRKLDKDYQAFKQMTKEFADKRLKFDTSIMENEIISWLNRTEDEICPTPILRDNILVVPGFLTHCFPSSRLEAILAAIKAPDNYKVHILATVFLRYECILQRGSHWTNPLEMYCSLVEDYGFDTEGFASPFNSQVVQLRKNIEFCSLYYDTDHIFGSMGSFFNVKSFVGRSVAVCPPYIESIFDEIVKVVKRDCEEAVRTNQSVRFFIGVAGWDDAKSIQTLDAYEHTLFVIKKPHMYFTDNKTDSTILNSFPNHYYMVSVNHPEREYLKIYECFDDMGLINDEFTKLIDNISSCVETHTLKNLDKFITNNKRINKFIAEKLFFQRKLKPDIFRLFNKYKEYIRPHILTDVLGVAHSTGKNVNDIIKGHEFAVITSKYD